MSSDPLDFFERSIRSIEESSGPVPNLRIDRLLGFSDSDGNRLFLALTDRYPTGHWALDQSKFGSAIEKAIQLLSAGLCGLGNKRFKDGHPLECCARIVNAPTLSPYIRRNKFNYVVVPSGFVSAIAKFVSATYAIAAIAAFIRDPDKQTTVWDENLLLGSIAYFADTNVLTFTRGVIEASSESANQLLLEDFDDSLLFSAFDREMEKKMMEMMPSASSWKRLGYRNLDEALAQHPEVGRYATKIARLSVCYAVCHEFGHVFTLSVDENEAQELGANEIFADMTGIWILYRLIDAGILPLIVGSEVTTPDLGHTLAAFHSWNLSKELSGLLREEENLETGGVFARLHEVANRWEEAMTLLRKVWTDDVPALTRVGSSVSVGFMIMNYWGVMTAGMLRAALLKKKHAVDIEMACKLLPLLSNRESKLYTYLAG